jgi:molecular chaperone DnaK (HSP70)
MKEIIEEIRKSRIRPEEIWFIDYIKDLEEVKSKNYPDCIFFKKDGEVVFEQNTKNMYLYTSGKIWSVFEKKFVLEYDEIKSLIKYWVEENLNRKGIIPGGSKFTSNFKWKNI